MVYHEELQCCCTQVKYWILRTSKVAFRRLSRYDVWNPQCSCYGFRHTNSHLYSFLYFVEFVVVVHSCFITKEEREEILEQREEKRIEKEFEEEIMKSPSMIPMTPGFVGQDHGMIPELPDTHRWLPRVPLHMEEFFMHRLLPGPRHAHRALIDSVLQVLLRTFLCGITRICLRRYKPNQYRR